MLLTSLARWSGVVFAIGFAILGARVFYMFFLEERRADGTPLFSFVLLFVTPFLLLAGLMLWRDAKWLKKDAGHQRVVMGRLVATALGVGLILPAWIASASQLLWALVPGR